MKRIVCLLLSLVLVLTMVPTFGVTAVTEDSSYWNYSVSNGEAIITDYVGPATDVVLPAALGGYPVTAVADFACFGRGITGLEIPEGVKTLGKFAFDSCGLTWVSIPSSVTYTGEAVFNDCRSLTTVTIADGVRTIGELCFDSCSAISSITLPSSVTKIEGSAFSECTSLSSITMSGVTSIGDAAFSQCTGLTSLTIPDSVTTMGTYVFSRCSNLKAVTIPETVTAMGGDIFTGCHEDLVIYGTDGSYAETYANTYSIPFVSIKTPVDHFTFEVVDGQATVISYDGDGDNVTVPATYEGYPVTAIGQSAFAFNHNITSVSLPDSITTIGASAFFYCRNMRSVNLPEGLTTLGGGCFGRCSSLESILLPSTLQTIENSVFSYCESLTAIDLAPGNQAFTVVDGVLFTADMKILEEYPRGSTATDYTVPAGVTTISVSAFTGSNHLVNVVLPGEVATIEGSAFYECINLESATIYNRTLIFETNFIFESWTSFTLRSYTGSSTHVYANENGIPFEALDFVPYNYTISNGEVTIQDYIGDLTEVTVPSTIEDYPVVALGNKAFRNNIRITKVTLPEGVRTLGNQVFEWCESLTQVHLPSTLESVGWNFAYGALKLKAFTMPWNNAYFTVVDGVLFNKDKTTLMKYPPNKAGATYTVPATVTKLGNISCCQIQNLKTVILPNDLLIVGDSAFSAGISLQSVVIPNKVTTLADFAFAGCESLVSITIPESVTFIGADTLYGCHEDLVIYGMEGSDAEYHAYIHKIPFNLMRLTSADGYIYTVSGGSATVVGYEGSQTDLVMPASLDGYPVVAIGAFAFNLASITSVVIPEGVTTIERYAFGFCQFLKSVTLPSSLRTIEECGFWYTALQSVTLPDGLTTLGEGAFGYTTCLNSVTIPASVTHIQGPVFNWSFISEILVAEGNPNYTSVDGVLFSKNGTVLLEYPEGKADKVYRVPEEVTTIAEGGFNSANYLTEAVLPQSVTSIGDNAFAQNDALTKIEIYNPQLVIGTGSFADCRKLTIYGYAGSTAQTYADALDIPFAILPTSQDDFIYAIVDGQAIITGYLGSNPHVTLPTTYNDIAVVGVADNAFAGNTEITGVDIPEGIESIGANAFAGCIGLTQVVLPDSVTILGASVFENCTGLWDVILSQGLEAIADSAFEGCTALAGITIPNGITTLGASAFKGCTTLSEVTLSQALTVVGDSTFAGCTALAGIALPDTLTTLGDGVFSGCTMLTSITLPEGATILGTGLLEGCTGLMTAHLPGGLTALPASFFAGCSALTAVTLPEGIVTLGDSAFQDCSSLISMVIPTGATAIGASAFENCSGMKAIWVPASVTAIGIDAFKGCSASLVIYGVAGSAMEQFAKENGLS
ncbi:MAG: leucine-rich repeat protein, partial [Clostridia bacterium]|nr:leucine-rich repeat protein [Clostridia bacterium]